MKEMAFLHSMDIIAEETVNSFHYLLYLQYSTNIGYFLHLGGASKDLTAMNFQTLFTTVPLL